MDSIRIDGILTRGAHGATAAERAHPQVLRVDAAVDIDLGTAAVSDDLHDTIDYAALRRRLCGIVETTSFSLLERLGAALLDAIFEDARVAAAEVTIAKPHILGGATPAVTLRRTR